MAEHTIADYLLRTIVGIKIEAGVSSSMIQRLVNEFASEQQQSGPADGMAGFLRIEDIPQHRRDDFISALNWLSIRLADRASATASALAA